MRPRKLIAEPKTQESDTRWRTSDLQPRYAPVFLRTLPNRGGWQWRSAKAAGNRNEYILLARCNPNRGNWQSILILDGSGGASVVARLEDHGSHPGLHAHTDCERSGLHTGPETLDGLLRIPPAGDHHRRKRAWTAEDFWESSRRFFRIETADAQGLLV